LRDCDASEKCIDDDETREVELICKCKWVGHLNCIGSIRIIISCTCVVLIERCFNIFEINIPVLKLTKL